MAGSYWRGRHLAWNPGRQAAELARQAWVSSAVGGMNDVIVELTVDPDEAYQVHRAEYVRTGDQAQLALALEYVRPLNGEPMRRARMLAGRAWRVLHRPAVLLRRLPVVRAAPELDGHSITGPHLALGGWQVYTCLRCPYRFRADQVVRPDE